MVLGRLRHVAARGAALFLTLGIGAHFSIQVDAQQLPFQFELPFQIFKPSPERPAAPSSRTRFVIGVERAITFDVRTLTSPNRVVVDIPSVRIELPTVPEDDPVGMVRSFRHGISAPGRTRVIIDVTGPVVVERSAVEKGPDGNDQLVVDLISAKEAAAVAELRAGARHLGAGTSLQPPVPKPALSPQARAAATFKPVIVIDPGHGGEDGGATKFGTLEKNVVLSFSLKLREKLNETGRYKVLMTREADVFVPLEERRDFAERNQAALFIAIHADYAARSTARGATIYSLRPQLSDSLRHAAKGAVKENVLSNSETAQIRKVGGDVNAVRDMLADLARMDVERKRERTSVLVRSVLNFMGTTTNMMENPDRSAAFVVLKTSTVPSILLELGYLTSQEDAQQLRSDQWRDKVSGSLVTAIDNYFSNQVARLPM
jgi:N-acetylmuramoyl-L-alanine amidase